MLVFAAFFGVYIAAMAAVAFDTLKLAQRLEAAGLPAGQAQSIAVALSETIGEAIVTREYLDLRLAEQSARLDARFAEVGGRFAEVGGRFAEVEGKIAEARAEILKWMFGAVGLQTLAILGGVPALLKLIGH
jgi:hypothetical protein